MELRESNANRFPTLYVVQWGYGMRVTQREAFPNDQLSLEHPPQTWSIELSPSTPRIHQIRYADTSPTRPAGQTANNKSIERNVSSPIRKVSQPVSQVGSNAVTVNTHAELYMLFIHHYYNRTSHPNPQPTCLVYTPLTRPSRAPLDEPTYYCGFLPAHRYSRYDTSHWKDRLLYCHSTSGDISYFMRGQVIDWFNGHQIKRSHASCASLVNLMPPQPSHLLQTVTYIVNKTQRKENREWTAVRKDNMLE